MENRNPNDQLTARIAGFTLLFYIVSGISGMVLRPVSSLKALVPLFSSLSALVLGVTFFSLTSRQHRDIALMALVCRVIEAVPGEGVFFFAVASMLFSWFLFRGKMVPSVLSTLGVVASVLLVFFFTNLGNWILWRF